ncbi:uncharacterized protein LOC119616758 [Kryptolebias marmoratus]|uniref:uncharacterized protein LOC119616758 n=1 Tax=Kryptolebias marmoratus TaxID=37003 RepID=UPI0018AC91A6|nr:uncharacterized protein LOC119616758 [Kryptolebias marmoratus]
MVRKWRKLKNELRQVKKTQLSFRGNKVRTTVAQKLPADYNEKLVIFRSYCSKHITEKHIQPSHITNMDEVPLTFDIPVFCQACGNHLTGADIHKGARKVLDVDRYYLLVTETLRYACDIWVIRIIRDRTQGNSSARLLKQLKENHGEEWLNRLGHYLEECANFVNQPSLSPVVCQEPPEPAVVPTDRWLSSVYGRDILSCIDHIKASITSTFGTILKLDCTKKITKKLAGHSKGTALRVSLVSDELGQILNSVLTVQEGPGLDKMAAGLMDRYRQAGVAPPKVLYVDCGCCVNEGLSKLQERFGEWPDLHIRLDIWHFMQRLAVGCTTDAHLLYPAFMRALSSCIFVWDAGDLDLLRRSKLKQLQQEQRPGVTNAMVDSHITKKELRTFCHRRTRGEYATLVQIEQLLEELSGPKGRDLMSVPLQDEVRMD